MSRGGRWERIAVRLNAILRKVPKQQSLDGKAWRAETSARRSLMRYIVGIVGRLIEEEDERVAHAQAAALLDGMSPEDRASVGVARQVARSAEEARAGASVDTNRECDACGAVIQAGNLCGDTFCRNL